MSKSIITDNMEKCFLCGSYYHIEKHHIFGGSNRKFSEKYGLYVPLCHWCHNEPPNGAHFNKEVMDELHRLGQEGFEEHYPELDFMKIFGRNYK